MPRARVVPSVLRQQLLEFGGKTILLHAEELGGDDAERAFELRLNKTLEQMRKVQPVRPPHRSFFLLACLSSSI